MDAGDLADLLAAVGQAARPGVPAADDFGDVSLILFGAANVLAKQKACVCICGA